VKLFFPREPHLPSHFLEALSMIRLFFHIPERGPQLVEVDLAFGDSGCTEIGANGKNQIQKRMIPCASYAESRVSKTRTLVRSFRRGERIEVFSRWGFGVRHTDTEQSTVLLKSSLDRRKRIHSIHAWRHFFSQFFSHDLLF